jgi:hypothetical protein
MVLPHRFPRYPRCRDRYRKLADIYGKPVIAYVKDDGYIDAAHIGKLEADAPSAREIRGSCVTIRNPILGFIEYLLSS